MKPLNLYRSLEYRVAEIVHYSYKSNTEKRVESSAKLMTELLSTLLSLEEANILKRVKDNIVFIQRIMNLIPYNVASSSIHMVGLNICDIMDKLKEIDDLFNAHYRTMGILEEEEVNE